METWGKREDGGGGRERGDNARWNMERKGKKKSKKRCATDFADFFFFCVRK